MSRPEYRRCTAKNVTGVVIRLLDSSQCGQMDGIVWSLKAAGFVYVSMRCPGWSEECRVGSWLIMDVIEVETDEEEQELRCHWRALNAELWIGPAGLAYYKAVNGKAVIGPRGPEYSEVRGLVCCVFSNKLFVWTEIFGKVFVGLDMMKGLEDSLYPMAEVHVGLVSAFGCGPYRNDCGWNATYLRILKTSKFTSMFPSVKNLDNLKLVKIYDNCAILSEKAVGRDVNCRSGSIFMSFNDYCDYNGSRLDNILDAAATYRALVVRAPAAKKYPYRALCVKAIPSALTGQIGHSSGFRQERPESAESVEDLLLPYSPPSSYTMSSTVRPGSLRSHGADSGGLFESQMHQDREKSYGAALAAGATNLFSSEVPLTLRTHAKSVGGEIDATLEPRPFVVAEPLPFRDEASPVFNVSPGFGNQRKELTTPRVAKSTIGIHRKWTPCQADSERSRALPAMVQCPWTEMEKQARASDFPPALPPPLEPVPVQNRFDLL